MSPAAAVFIVLAISAAVGSLFFAAFGLAAGGGEWDNRVFLAERCNLFPVRIGKMTRM